MTTLVPLFRPVLPAEGPGGDTWRAIPLRSGKDGSRQVGKRLLVSEQDRKATAARHAEFLERVADCLRPALARGETLRVMVPMASRALWTNEAASAITRVARNLEPPLRTSLIIDLFGFEEVPKMAAVEDAMIPLMPFFDTFVAEPHRACTDFTVFANTNVQGVTRNLQGANWNLQEAMRQLKDFWAAATKRRLYIYLQEMECAGPAELGRRYQAAGMDGPYLGGEADKPTGITTPPEDDDVFMV